MDFLGRVKRTVPYKNKNVRDSVVEAWMKADDVRFEECYVMCTPNAPAMTKSIAKYNRVQPLLNKEAWKLAGQWTEKHFVRMNGSMILPLARVMKEADRQTSAGYPWNLKYVNKGAFMDSPEFVGVMDRYWEALGTEKEMVPIWTASLKHEMRPIAKIESNSIRTFTASPTEHSLACNRLFLDQNELFYKAHTTTWSFVGCSKYYLGFDRLYKRLSKHPNAFELDESAFDASLFREALEGQREIRWGMLRPFDRTPENRKRVENVYKSIIDSIIVLDNGEVVQKHTGNPSGSANTIVDNTMILYRLFAYAWLCLVAERMEEGKDFLNQGQFESHVEAALNGDDNTFTCSNAVVSWFNPRSISKVWTGIGVVTTMPHMKNCPFEEKGDALTCKNPECEKPRRLEQVAFLSQEFVKIDDIWLPKPERNKVLCSLLNASELDDVRWTLLRVSALRMESWPDVQLRKELVRLQQYIWKHHAFSMKGSVKDISMKDIAALWKTDEEIRRLYMCPKLEGGYEDMQKMESIMAIGGCEMPRFLSESKELKAGASLRLRKCAVCACEVVTYCVEEYYSCVDCRLKIDEVQESVKPVPQDYKSPPPNKWRGKGKGSKGFTFLSQSLNLYGDTEMRIPYMTKSGKAKGKGAAQKKKGAQPKKGKAKKKAKSNVGGMGPQAKRYAAPVQMGSVRTTQGAKSRPFTVTHRESLGTITSPGSGFTVSKQIAVNPGLPASFPWLSNIAQQYETYKFKKIRYCYETRSSTSNAGVVIMVTNYDASEGAFTSTQQAENYRGATVGQPWISFSHELTKASMNDYNRHYVRAGAQVSGTDIKTYDVGNFSLILSGISVAAGQLLGELYVEYVVDVFDPRVQVPIGQYLPMWHAVSGSGAGTNAAPLTGGSIRAGSTLGITISSTTSVTVPAVGRYMVTASMISATLTVRPTITLDANSSLAAILGNSSTGNVVGEVANSQGLALYIIDVNAPNSVWTLTGGTGATAGNYDLLVSQISSGLTLKEQKVDEKQLEVKQDLQAIWALLKKAGLAATPMDVAGAAKASADGQPRRPYRAVEIDSDGESVLVNTAAAAGAGADRKDPPNGTPSQRRK